MPFHVAYGNTPVAPPKPEEAHDDEVAIEDNASALPENSGSSTGISGRQHSILRKGMDTAAARARGQSSSRKHVDFSLGMSSMSSGDIMGDVFEDRSVQIEDIVRASNREAAERRIQEEAEEEEERRSRTSSRTSKSRRPSRQSALSPSGRPSTDAPSVRSGVSSISRNRFFRHHSSISHNHEDMMEQGNVSVPPPAAASEHDHDKRV
jgi:hypothetical protein